MFTREALLASDWYRQRLQVKRERDLAMWRRNLDELLRFQQNPHNVDEARRLDLGSRIAYAQAQFDALEQPDSWRTFIGTLGADPLEPIEAPQIDIGDARVSVSALG
jgi:hypothetical protein